MSLSSHKLITLTRDDMFRGASSALALKVVGVSSTFLLNLFVARYLGATMAGHFFLSITVITVAATLGRSGMDNVLLRHIALHDTDLPNVNIFGGYKYGMSVVFFVSAAITSIVAISSSWLGNVIFNKEDVDILIRILSISILPLSLGYVLAQCLKGLKRIVYAIFIESVSVPLVACLSLLILAPRYGVIGASWGYVLSTSAALLIGWIFWSKSEDLRRDTDARFRVPEMSRMNRSAISFLIITASQLTIAWTPTLALGVWGSAKDVAIYSVCHRISLLVPFILVASNSALAPRVAALYAQGRKKELENTFRQATIVISAIGSGAVVLLYLFRLRLLGLFGTEFTGGEQILGLLLSGQFVNVITGSVGVLLMMCNSEKLMMYNLACIATISIICSIIFIPQYGPYGGAIVSAIAVAGQNIVATLIVKSRLNISLWSFKK